MLFNFTYHDIGGRIIGHFSCNDDWYDSAYQKAKRAANSSVHAIQYCDENSKQKDIYGLPHLISYIRPEQMAPFGVPSGWGIALKKLLCRAV